MLALDGVYAEDRDGRIRFHRALPPSDTEVAQVAGRIHRRVRKLLDRQGLGPQTSPEEADTLLQDQPLLAGLYNASISGRVFAGPRAGGRLAKVEVDGEDLAVPSGRRCASLSGFSVHADLCISARDRKRLERLRLLPDGKRIASINGRRPGLSQHESTVAHDRGVTGCDGGVGQIEPGFEG